MSSYSLEGKTSIFELIKNNIDKNDELKNNLFPMKSDYLDFILSEDYDEAIMGKIKSNFTDYIIYTNEDYSKEHFYHCFQYEFERENGFTLNLNFGVLIFYEKINSVEMNLQKMKKKHKKDKDIYLGKALVLISDKAVFSLMKNILEKIYELLKSKKLSEYLNSFSVSSILVNPLKNLNENFDSFIVNLFNSLKKNDKIISFIDKKDKNSLDYYPKLDSILPFCDLNLGFFFKIFDINDIFLIAEYYFLNKPILIISPNPEILYPIYHILMNLFFPLNIHTRYRFYHLLNPVLVYTGLLGPVPIFYFIYTDKKKNHGFIEENILRKIAENKIDTDILIIQIKKHNDKKSTIDIKKNIYLYEKVDDKFYFSKTPTEKKNKKTLIEKTMRNHENYSIYYLTITSQIKLIMDNMKKTESDFFQFPNDLKNYDLLKKNFFGLIIKFLVNKIRPVTFKLNDDNKMEFLPLELREEKKDFQFKKNYEFENIIDVDLKDFYEESPQREIIYKSGIINTTKFDINYLQNQILIDYLIKINQYDPKRLYFDDDLYNDKTKLDIDYQNPKKILFEDLFEQISNLGKINSIKPVKKMDLSKSVFRNKSNKEINLISPNFKLNFETKLGDKFQLFKKYISMFIGNKSDCLIKNNPDKYKYYYLILYEAKNI